MLLIGLCYLPSAICYHCFCVEEEPCECPCGILSCCREASTMSLQPWQSQLSFSDRLSAVMKMQVNPEIYSR